MNYLYGILNNVDTTMNRITVGKTVFRTSAKLARSVQEQKLVGQYVKVRFSFGHTIDRANEVTKEVGHGKEYSTGNARIDC